jgi:hypothetical protein
MGQSGTAQTIGFNSILKVEIKTDKEALALALAAASLVSLA